nr:hypothetical protein GCM10020092_074660 [Actinoplanes digitatis]
MTEEPPRPHRFLFGRGSWPEVSRIGEVLRTETVGGALLLGAAMLALVLANSPWSSIYQDLGALRVGPHSLRLDLTLAQWAGDGLLAIFFFVAGLELKREFVAGDLRDPRRAIMPVAAAVGGMAAPALVYTAINSRHGRRSAVGVGGADGDGHCVRARGPRCHLHAPAGGVTHVSADARCRR